MASISDCMMSLRKWDRLIAPNILNAVVLRAGIDREGVANEFFTDWILSYLLEIVMELKPELKPVIDCLLRTSTRVIMSLYSKSSSEYSDFILLHLTGKRQQ
ncbi:MAG: hypothetical protein ACYC3O_04070 [Burkholderiales bacterium]